ncbi:MAG: hypothetical protein ACYTGC_04365, partial [Planctomycetota bacterium]
QIAQLQSLPSAARRFALEAAGRFESAAPALAQAGDPLARLEPLEISAIGRALQEGEAAIVIGPEGASVIPSNKLIPRSNLQVTAGSVSFDQRFRGEQLIASSIRTLQVERMPMVVFVHAEPIPLLRSQEQDADLVGVAQQLEASGYVVEEWRVAESTRPAGESGQPIVWVVVPPIRRTGLEPMEGELELIQITETLIDEGRPVLLSIFPSLNHKYGRSDPWMKLPRKLGLDVDTAAVVYEVEPVSEDSTRLERGQTVIAYPAGHPIASALQGQQSYFPLPIPLRPLEATAAQHTALVEVRPSSERWLEREWMQQIEQADPPPDDERLKSPMAIAAAVERTGAAVPGSQRVIVVGSGAWMLSYTADVAVNVGGDRFALLNPGNHELMLTSVAWLAGLDELIAASPAAQQVSRLHGISAGSLAGWRWLTLAGLPGAYLLVGAMVWVVRRR